MSDKQPLSGVRVLDLTRVFAGPLCTQTLADLGAEVIKIERPRTGDDTRGWGPPYLTDSTGAPTQESAYYLSTNRGKKSVTVDISKPQGQAILRELAASSQVLVENFKVGDLTRYGLDYQSVKKINPSIVYCSITGFGQTGPEAKKPGYDFIFQGIGGLMSITGERDDLAGGGPQKVGIGIGDALTGLHSVIGILGAILHQRATGEGQQIDVALLDSIVALTGSQAASYFCSGEVPRRWGNGHPNIVPYDAFEVLDGHLIVAVGNDSQFRDFCRVIERPDLARDSRYERNQQRVRNRDQLLAILREVMKTRTRSEWMRMLEQVNVPCGPINNIAEVFDEPQVRHKGLRIAMQHPLSGSVDTVANPVRMSATPVRYAVPPPVLGQHTKEVLSGILGLEDSKLDDLAAAGVI